MDYIKIAEVSEFEGRDARSYRVMGRYVGVFKNPDGSFFAMESGCKHANADLTLGLIRDGVVTCHRHGWQYDLKTGECLLGNSTPLRKYGCKVEGDEIHITTLPLEED